MDIEIQFTLLESGGPSTNIHQYLRVHLPEHHWLLEHNGAGAGQWQVWMAIDTPGTKPKEKSTVIASYSTAALQSAYIQVSKDCFFRKSMRSNRNNKRRD